MVFMGISVVSPKSALPHVTTDLSDSMAANALRGPAKFRIALHGCFAMQVQKVDTIFYSKKGS
jgi:hypothetical protein